MAVSLSLPQSGFDPELFFFLGSHLRAIYWHSPEMSQKVQDACGEGEIHTFYTPVSYLPCYHIVLMERWCVIVLEGMTFAGQLLNNIVGAIPAVCEGYPGLVCPFYADSANQLLIQFYAWLVERLGTRRIIVCGHSYGGACAQLIAHRLCVGLPGQVEAAVIFGAPRVGNRVWTENQLGVVRRLQTVEDLICTLPPNDPTLLAILDGGVRARGQYLHAGVGWDLGHNGEIDVATETGQLPRDYPPARVQIRGTGHLPGHDMYHYLRRLRGHFHHSQYDRSTRFPDFRQLDNVNAELDALQGISVSAKS